MTIQEMRDIKQEYGLSNQELSKRTGLPISTIQRIFSGSTRSPRMETLIALESTLRAFAESSSRVLRETAPLPYSLHPPGKYTVDDYYALPDDRRVELIDGVFYDMAAPSLTHQTILGELHLQFRACADAHGEGCDVYLSPCDVQLDRDEKTMLQPDLFVICREYDRNARALFGEPDLVVEILSPSSRSRDLVLKLNKYFFAKVREYWIVDPENEEVLVYDFENTSFRPEVYSFDAQIPIHISCGACSVDFARIHRRLNRDES